MSDTNNTMETTESPNVESVESTDLQAREKRESQDALATREGVFFEPEVDIFEDERGMTLVADLPGASEEDVKIELDQRVLTILATVEPVDSAWKPAYSEYRVGSYRRSFRVGRQIDADRISAEMRDGVLTVSLPRLPEAAARTIEVRSGS